MNVTVINIPQKKSVGVLTIEMKIFEKKSYCGLYTRGMDT